jgi:curved DNA-binding protein CbpA
VDTTKTETLINYYEILETHPKASQHEIYQSYQKIKKTYSLKNPDIFRNFTVEEVQQLSYMIEDAYATIGNQLMREIYDAKFAEHFPPTQEISEESPLPSDAELSKKVLHEAAAEKSAMASTNTNSPERAHHYEVDENFETLITTQDYFDGVFLGKIRKYKKISIEDFSKKTCINTKYLYAIESNNYSALPAAVFTRGYIHQYCKLLNLDIEKVVSSYMKLFANGRE